MCVCVCALPLVPPLPYPPSSNGLSLSRKVGSRVPARYESFAKGARSYRVGWERRSSFQFHRARPSECVVPLSKSNESSIDLVVAMPYRRLIEEYRKAEPKLFSIGVKNRRLVVKDVRGPRAVAICEVANARPPTLSSCQLRIISVLKAATLS